MEKTLEQNKLELINWIANLDDGFLVSQLVELKESDYWNEIPDAEKESIKAGLEDAKSGRVVPHQEVMKLFEKYIWKS